MHSKENVISNRAALGEGCSLNASWLTLSPGAFLLRQLLATKDKRQLSVLALFSPSMLQFRELHLRWRLPAGAASAAAPGSAGRIRRRASGAGIRSGAGRIRSGAARAASRIRRRARVALSRVSGCRAIAVAGAGVVRRCRTIAGAVTSGRARVAHAAALAGLILRALAGG